MSIGELFQIKKDAWIEQLKVIRAYYPKNYRFALADFFLGLSTFFYNPYSHVRKKGCVYGETPIHSLHTMINKLRITKEDTWLELGSGRGKGAFWISQFVGCKTIAIDHSSLFIFVARAIQRILKIKHLTFLKRDIFEADFKNIQFVYFYSTCASYEEMDKLIEKMKEMPTGGCVITISSPLPESCYFVKKNSFEVSFPWGEATCYLNYRT